MGGTHSPNCNAVARQLVLWCKNKRIWLTACHIAGSSNEDADELSRNINDNIEWMLNTQCFRKVCNTFGKPSIDIFASRINHQLPSYFSYVPDEQALAIDAFAHTWNFFAYIFPPFNLIPRVLRKIREDRTEKAILIVPKWNGAPWFPKMAQMLLKPPLHLGKNINNLVLPQDLRKIHPLCPKLKLMACFLSGKNSKIKV